MCSYKVPISILDQMDKYRKHCLWNRGDINKKRGCLVAWKNATRTKNQGGLDILDLRAHNITLLLKHPHKFYNKKDIPWVHLTWNVFYSRFIPDPFIIGKKVGTFWWRDIMSLSNHFFMMASVKAVLRHFQQCCYWSSPLLFFCWREFWSLGRWLWMNAVDTKIYVV
jgi:hypothetical protein